MASRKPAKIKPKASNKKKAPPKNLKASLREDLLNAAFINYLEGVWNVNDIAKKMRLKERTIEGIIQNEQWSFCREIFNQTRVFYPRPNREHYFALAENPKAIANPFSGNVNLNKLTEIIKDRYIFSFPRTSIESLLSELGLSRYLCHVLEISEKEKWEEVRQGHLERLKHSRDDEFERRRIAFEDTIHALLMKRLNIENAYLDGNLTFAKGTIKKQNEDGTVADKEVYERVVSGFTGKDLLDFSISSLYGEKIEQPKTQIIQQNNQIHWTNGMTKEEIQDLAKTFEHLAAMKQRGKNVLTIEDIREEEERDSRAREQTENFGDTEK